MDPQQGYPQQDAIVGQTIGNYLVTQKLGEGGMGAVYLAEHPGIGKKVALKILHSEFCSNSDVAGRFFDEAKAVNNINHPNIVDIIDYGIIPAQQGRDQLVYFMMEYLGGLTLSQLIRTEAPLPPERALQISLQVADALSASHRCGIVHRDLKPDNIMLLQRGRDRDFVKLLDFGIAKLTTNAEGSRRTRTGIVMGTPAYMSPEQCDGRGNIDHRTDIYALGIVVYEMLVGHVPFGGEGYGEILVKHLTQPPVAPSQFRMINPHVEAVVMKALEKRVENRFPTMDEMMRAMSDPVGYVEAHGGIANFGQVQLMPSNAPLTTSVRLSSHIPTPAPGHLMPMPMATPTTGMQQPTYTPTPIPATYGTAAAAPTTLGGAAGAHLTPTPMPLPEKKTRLGLVVAACVVLLGAVIAIAVVMKKSRSAGADEPTADSGSEVASGSERVVTPPPPAPDAAPREPDVAKGSDAVKPAGSGSDTIKTVDTPKFVTVTIVTTPPGARIIVNGVTLDQVTPQPFELPIGTKEAKIVLQLDGYKDVVERLVPNQNLNLEKNLVKKPRSTYVPPVGKGSGSATPVGKGSNTPPVGKGSGSGKHNDTIIIKPGDD